MFSDAEAENDHKEAVISHGPEGNNSRRKAEIASDGDRGRDEAVKVQKKEPGSPLEVRV